jgi:hypothetical protein
VGLTLGPVFSGWGVAKWQGTWLWTTHSEVRILPPQLCLPERTETALAATQPSVSHFLRDCGWIGRSFPIKCLGEPLSVHVRLLTEYLLTGLGRESMRIRCVAVEVLALVSRDIKHLCGPEVEIFA